MVMILCRWFSQSYYVDHLHLSCKLNRISFLFEVLEDRDTFYYKMCFIELSISTKYFIPLAYIYH
jgi:hypothetical protein